MKSKDLFVLLVAGCIFLVGPVSAETVSQDLPVAFLPEKSYQFQPVPEGTEITHTFKIQNKGSAPLQILKIIPGWGCTTVSFTRQIPPGGEGIIKIKGDTTDYGGRKFSRNIIVETNDPKHPKLYLKIFGNVENFAVIKPKHVRLAGPVGTELKAVVTIIPGKKYPFQITDTKAEKGKNIQFELKQITRENRPAYLLTVENTKKTKGRYRDKIRLYTDSTIRPQISIWVFGHIEDAKKKGKK